MVSDVIENKCNDDCFSRKINYLLFFGFYILYILLDCLICSGFEILFVNRFVMVKFCIIR